MQNLLTSGLANQETQGLQNDVLSFPVSHNPRKQHSGSKNFKVFTAFPVNLKASFPGAVAGGGYAVSPETAARQWADLAVRAVEDAEEAEKSIVADTASVQASYNSFFLALSMY